MSSHTHTYTGFVGCVVQSTGCRTLLNESHLPVCGNRGVMGGGALEECRAFFFIEMSPHLLANKFSVLADDSY